MEDEEDIIKFLVDLGILKDAGYNDDIGENLYHIQPEAKDIFPSLSKAQMQSINQSVFDLWELDMLNVMFDENGEPLIGLNENSLSEDKINAIQNEDLRRQHIMIVSVFNQYFDR